MNLKTKSILKRLLKGTIAGVVTSLSVVTLAVPSTWSELASTVNALALAGIYGAITGLLLALNKWAVWKD